MTRLAPPPLPFRGRNATGAPRRAALSSASTPDERAEIHAALQQGGYQHPSHGIRSVLLAYARAATVRDAVATFERAQ